jgi:hypothetical protein
MEPDEPSFGPLQLIVVGFPDLDHFTGRIAREMASLRGRGLMRVLDARMLSRHPDGTLTETDLNPVIGEEAGSAHRPVAHLFGLNGHAEVNGGGNGMTPDTFARTAGFAVEDLRRLTDEIPAGAHAAVVLVEHVWAGTLRASVRAANGLLIGQGLLTPEVMMIVGAELQAKADAEAAIELAEAARGAALIEAIRTLAGDSLDSGPQPRAAAAAAVVGALVDEGLLGGHEAAEAIDALAHRGIVEQAILHGAAAEAEDLLSRLEDDPPPA